jgi:hypothetical protein
VWPLRARTVGTEEAAPGEHAETGAGERGVRRWQTSATGWLPAPDPYRLLATAGVGLVIAAYVRVLHGVSRGRSSPGTRPAGWPRSRPPLPVTAVGTSC